MMSCAMSYTNVNCAMGMLPFKNAILHLSSNCKRLTTSTTTSIDTILSAPPTQSLTSVERQLTSNLVKQGLENGTLEVQAGDQVNN